MLRARLADFATYACLFLLPWQTRWIYRDLVIAGEGWEYGRLSLYAVELLAFVAVALRGRLWFPPALVPFVRPVALLLSVAVISASFSYNVTLALATLPHLAAAAAVFSLVADERTDPRRAAWAFVAGLAVPSAFAWYQVVTGTSPSSSWLGLAPHDAVTLGQSVVETETGRILRGYGTFPHPNVFGGYLAVGLVAVAWLVRGAKTHGTRLLVSAPAVLFASALIITFSRSAWLAAALGFGVLAVAALVLRRAVPHRAIPFVLFALFSIFATLLVFHSAVFTRFQPAARLEAKSIEERVGSYAAFDDVLLTNVVMGAGPGNYTAVLATLYPGRPAWSYQPVHNAPLLAFAESGLLVLLPAVLFLRALWHHLRERRSSTNALFALALLVALLPIALLDHYLWSLWPGLALMAFSIGFGLKTSA